MPLQISASITASYPLSSLSSAEILKIIEQSQDSPLSFQVSHIKLAPFFYPYEFTPVYFLSLSFLDSIDNQLLIPSTLYFIVTFYSCAQEKISFKCLNFLFPLFSSKSCLFVRTSLDTVTNLTWGLSALSNPVLPLSLCSLPD